MGDILFSFELRKRVESESPPSVSRKRAVPERFCDPFTAPGQSDRYELC